MTTTPEPPQSVRPFACQVLPGASLCVFFAGVLALWMAFVPATAAQPSDSEQLEHFKWVRTITLSDPDAVHPDSLLIGWIWSMDVGPEGQMLIVDFKGQETLLFDPDGNLTAVLDPTLCHPGFLALPVVAKFVGDQSIFVSNGGSPMGYRFTPAGDCLGSVDPEYQVITQGRDLDVGSRGSLFGVYEFPDRQVIRQMDSSGKTLREIALPPSDFPNATNRIDMGGLVVDDAHMFYAGVAEPHILKLTLDGDVAARISERSSWFRDVSRDLSDVRLSAIGQSGNPLGEFHGSYTLVQELFELTDKAIMVEYQNSGRGSGYQVFAKDGVLVAEELGIGLTFNFVKAGRAYRVVQPEQDDSGETPNPRIDVYQFVFPE